MNRPQTMQAVAIDNYGGKEVLKVRKLPVPEVGPGEVLIQVEAAGVGVWDSLIRQGFMKDFGPATFPLVLGGDGSGVVETLGDGVTDFKVGDKVYGVGFLNPKGGFFAEYIVLPVENVARVPKNVKLSDAAALAIPGLTALEGVKNALKVKRGDSVLIYGVGSVGHVAVQLAKRLQARVCAVASGEDSVALALAAGADVAVNGKTADLAETIRRFAPDGLSAVLATVNGKGLEVAIASIRRSGTVAYPNGVQPVPHGGPGVEAVAFNAIPNRESYDALNALIEAGPFTVQIDKSFPLSEVVPAHTALEKHHLGRMVLVIAP